MTTLQMTVNTLGTWFKHQLSRLMEQRWLGKSLRAKMGVLVTTGLLGLMTIFGILAVSSARQATQRALNERLVLTQMSTETLDAMLYHIVDDMALYAQLFSMGVQNENIQEPLASLGKISVFHQPIYHLDESGKLITTSASLPPRIDWNEVPAVQSAFEGQESNISAWPQYEPGTVVVATPITDPFGEVSGVLATLLDLSDPNFFPVEHNFHSRNTGVIDLVDPAGQVVFSSNLERVLQNLTEDLILERLFVTQDGGVETCLGCSGATPDELSDEVVAFAPLSSVPLGVVIRQPAQEVFASVRRLVVWHTVLGAISMLGALVLVWVTTNSVINPLKTLNDAAQRMARGDLETPIDLLTGSWPFNRSRTDEIGTLGISLDNMRGRLKNSIDESNELNRSLDARVQERTAEAIAAQTEAQIARDDLQAIIDALSDEMIVINVEDRRIAQVNQACLSQNQDLGDITELTCQELFHDDHPCFTTNSVCPMDDVIKTGEPVRVTHLRAKLGDKQPAYLDIIASPLRNSKGEITRIVELVRDITEERTVSESLVRRNQQLAILNAVATTVGKSLDIKEILGLALKEVIQRTRVEIGAVFLLEDVLGQLNLMAHIGLSEDAAKMVSRFGMLDGGCGGVIDHGQLVVVPDITGYRGQRARALQKEQLTTLVHVPLTSRGRTLGSMCVGTHHFKEFGEIERKMLMAIGKQIGVAIENARLYAELQQKEQMRRELFRKAINVQEDERKRIARELHDDTSQALTALMFAAEEGLEIEDLDEVKVCLERIHTLTLQTLDGVHELLYDLRPSMLDHLGLMPAIRWFTESRLEPHGVRVNISEYNNSCRLLPEAEIAIFRVVQEAVTNISRHAGARNVKICCDLKAEMAKIEISDDGIGFDPSLVSLSPDTGQGFGLLGMSERLELVGGSFVINSSPGEGTCIDIRVPLHGNGRRENLA